MEQVLLGHTGLTVSRLSFGTALLGPLSDRLSAQQGARLLLQALDLGVYFWDTSDDYGTHPHVAEGLRLVSRHKVVISSKAHQPAGAVKRILLELGTDYLDILLMHDVGLDSADRAREGLALWQRDRVEGRVRALGISTHSARVARLAADWPEAEVLLLPVNSTGICTRDSQIEDGGVEEVLEAARRAWAMGKGVVAMKVMGCGMLTGDPQAAISFAAKLPFVHSLCIGMRGPKEVEANVRMLALAKARERPPAERSIDGPPGR